MCPFVPFDYIYMIMYFGGFSPFCILISNNAAQCGCNLIIPLSKLCLVIYDKHDE